MDLATFEGLFFEDKMRALRDHPIGNGWTVHLYIADNGSANPWYAQKYGCRSEPSVNAHTALTSLFNKLEAEEYKWLSKQDSP